MREECTFENVGRVSLPGRGKIDLCHRHYTGAIFAAVAAGVTSAVVGGIAIYNASNPPKNPEDATKSLAKIPGEITKLEKNIANENARGPQGKSVNQKKISDWQAQIAKLNETKSYLETYIGQNGAPGQVAGVTNPPGPGSNTGTDNTAAAKNSLTGNAKPNAIVQSVADATGVSTSAVVIGGTILIAGLVAGGVVLLKKRKAKKR